MRCWLSLCFLLVLVAFGCGGVRSGAPTSKNETKAERDWVYSPGAGNDEAKAPDPLQVKEQGPEKGKQAPGDPAPAPANKPRLVVYNGDIHLVVEKFDDAAEALVGLVQEHGGYIAGSNASTATGQARNGSWTLKIPVAKFQAFRAAVGKLGEVVRVSLKSDDISDRFYDLETRVKNLKAEEDKLRAMYEKSAHTVSDVKEFSRMLADLRGEIEVKEGQLKRWTAQAAEATITVTIQEKSTYRPPVTVPPPSFGNSASETFSASWNALVSVGQFIALVGIALAPWLPVLLVVFGLAWLVLRRANKTRKTPPPLQPVVVQPAAPH